MLLEWKEESEDTSWKIFFLKYMYRWDDYDLLDVDLRHLSDDFITGWRIAENALDNIMVDYEEGVTSAWLPLNWEILTLRFSEGV